MSRRNRDRKPARRPDTIEARQRILVLCEGKRTEPEYIAGFKNWCRNPLVEVAILGAEGVPLTLVTNARDCQSRAADAAKREKDENLLYDQVWCIFDRDDHPHFKEAIKMAADNGLYLAVSVPCFELWLLLHFRENPGLRHRNELRRLLEKHIIRYDKTVDFGLFVQGYRLAHRRAAALDEHCRQDNEAFRNPSTGVYRLTEQIGRYSWLEARSHDTDSSSSRQHVNPDTTRQGPRSREAR
jgi:RloB-like protein